MLFLTEHIITITLSQYMLDTIIPLIEVTWPIGVCILVAAIAWKVEKRHGYLRNLTVKKAKEAYINVSLTLFSVIVFIGILEGVCRLSMKPDYHRRAAVPLWGQGNFEGERSIEEIKKQQNGPIGSGYAELFNGSYYYNPDPILDAHWREAWLYDDQYRSKYLLQDVQKICANEPESIRIFVNGGSVAAGTGSSTTERSWHILLETMLREKLGREDIYVFNCSVGAFVTSQERLSFDRAIAPFIGKGTIVINLNGYNDIGALTAPGDPMLVGRMYANDLGDPALKTLRRYSYLGRFIVDRISRAQLNRMQYALLSDEDRIISMSTSVTNICESNTRHQMRIGRLLGAQTFTFLQPWTCISAMEVGKPVDPAVDDTSPEMLRYHATCRKSIIARMQDEEDWVDLSSLFSTPDLLATYTDSCHFSDRGHEAMAKEICRVILPRIENELTTPDNR